MCGLSSRGHKILFVPFPFPSSSSYPPDLVKIGEGNKIGERNKIGEGNKIGERKSK